MTKEEYLDEYATKYPERVQGFTRTEDGFVDSENIRYTAAPCQCGTADCGGWRMNFDIGGTFSEYEPEGGPYAIGTGPGFVH